jgi:hypothetical protein
MYAGTNWVNLPPNTANTISNTWPARLPQQPADEELSQQPTVSRQILHSEALKGLLMPFRAVGDAVEGKARKVGDKNLMIEKIDLGRPDQVIAKFLPRIVDSALDPVGSVQEVAMDLMLVLLKDGFLDDVNNDKLWDQTN